MDNDGSGFTVIMFSCVWNKPSFAVLVFVNVTSRHNVSLAHLIVCCSFI